MYARILISLAALAVSAFAQGTILFDNRPPTGDAPILRPDGTGAGAGITAQLFVVGDLGTLTPLYPTTTFKTSSHTDAYFVEPVILTVPGLPAGSTAMVRMRAWEGQNYRDTWVYGESNDIEVRLGGVPPDGSSPLPPAPLNSLQGFQMVIIPEPSTWALLALGAGILLLRTRRRNPVV